MNPGNFYVGEPFFKDKEVFAEVLAKMKFVPARVEHLFMERKFEYSGYSPLFDKLGEAERIPDYEITVHDYQTTKEISVTVRKVTCLVREVK